MPRLERYTLCPRESLQEVRHLEISSVAQSARARLEEAIEVTEVLRADVEVTREVEELKLAEVRGVQKLSNLNGCGG